MTDGELRELTQKFWRLPNADFPDELRFDSTLKGFSSVRFLTFLAAVEDRARKRMGDPTALVSYRKLREALAVAADGSVVTREPPLRTSKPERAGAPQLSFDSEPLRLGHDIEAVDSLPAALDDPFYRRCFTPGEIAYCTAQSQPRRHFAARFAAKEALQKCDPVLTRVAMTAIEIVTGDDGRPRLRILDADVARSLGSSRIAVSLSHTDGLASAVVVIS